LQQENEKNINNDQKNQIDKKKKYQQSKTTTPFSDIACLLCSALLCSTGLSLFFWVCVYVSVKPVSYLSLWPVIVCLPFLHLPHIA